MRHQSRHHRRRSSRRTKHHTKRRHHPHRGGLLTPEQRNELLINSHYSVKDPRGYARSLFNEFQEPINQEKATKTFNVLYKRLHREHARIVAELDEIIASHPYNAARFTRPLLYELELLRAAASRNYDGMIHAIPFNKGSKYFTEMTDNRRKLKALLDLIEASLANYAPQIANLSMQRGNMSANFLSGNLVLEGVNSSSLNEPELVSPEYNMRSNFLRGNLELK